MIKNKIGMDPGKKYLHYLQQFPVNLSNRTWPDKFLATPPVWCSVDLRDGNQALMNPMDQANRLEMWNLLTRIGFKHIEIGFPSASKIDFDFARHIIENNLIPGDVVIQALTQSREHLIEDTFRALDGAPRAIVHLYNSTSKAQRDIVFNKARAEIIEIMKRGAEQIKELAAQSDTEIILEYSPESFTGTELDFSLEICQAVEEVWNPGPRRKLIINLPSTVEMSTPNIYADMIEWMCRELGENEHRIISLHTHNDRFGGVVSAEFGLLAGGTRVEGTLFGNGERTGNLDLVTLALNLYTQGIDPGLDFSDIPSIRRTVERCIGIPVHPRHPYAGDLVLTAFSGSHQDAIAKGLRVRLERIDKIKSEGGTEHDVAWDVPYLPIDPKDIGREFEPIIRVNAQSGKGGIAFTLEEKYGFSMPKRMHSEFARAVQLIADKTAKEVHREEIWGIFERNYLKVDGPLKLDRFVAVDLEERGSSYVNSDSRNEFITSGDVDNICETALIQGTLTFHFQGSKYTLVGFGNGPIDAAKHALEKLGFRFRLEDYHSHTLGRDSNAKCATYIGIITEKLELVYGIGVHTSTDRANLKALICAVNRAFPDALEAKIRDFHAST